MKTKVLIDEKLPVDLLSTTPMIKRLYLIVHDQNMQRKINNWFRNSIKYFSLRQHNLCEVKTRANTIFMDAITIDNASESNERKKLERTTKSAVPETHNLKMDKLTANRRTTIPVRKRKYRTSVPSDRRSRTVSKKNGQIRI